MSFRLPSEIIVNRVLPTLRAGLVREMGDRGITQQEIADYLGVTQAAVSKYASGEITVESRIRDDPRTQETIERIAEGFESGTVDEYEALAEILDLIREFEDRGPICELHEEAMPALQGLGCDLCVRGTDDRLTAERDVLDGVRRAARRLATTDGTSVFIPNVGTNVGYALSDATDPTDVAAIPGRMYTTNNRVKVPADPEFGASRNVATVILAAMATDTEMRGALNLVTDDSLLNAARDSGIEPMEFDAEYEQRRKRLRERFQQRGTVPSVVYHRGAFGIEPITYVLGETAEQAATVATDLIDVLG